MKIIQYTEDLSVKVCSFIQKTFAENSRTYEPNGKDSDILNIMDLSLIHI